MTRPNPLALSAAVVQRLLPLRPPFLLVERVEAFALGPPPALRASRGVSVNDPVFAGHFPGLAVLPGTQILEGMAQASALLAALVLVCRGFEREGRTMDEALDALRNLDRGFRLDPRYRPGSGDALLAAIDPFAPPGVGMLASSQVKFVHPVFPGDRLGYTVRVVREMEMVWHFECEADAEGETVARGALTNALVQTRLPR